MREERWLSSRNLHTAKGKVRKTLLASQIFMRVKLQHEPRYISVSRYQHKLLITVRKEASVDLIINGTT